MIVQWPSSVGEGVSCNGSARANPKRQYRKARTTSAPGRVIPRTFLKPSLNISMFAPLGAVAPPARVQLCLYQLQISGARVVVGACGRWSVERPGWYLVLGEKRDGAGIDDDGAHAARSVRWWPRHSWRAARKSSIGSS